MQTATGNGLQLDFNDFDRSVCQILQRMGVCRAPYNVSGMARNLTRLAVGLGAYFAHFGQVYNYTVFMGMHRDLLVRRVIPANHTNLGVIDFNFESWGMIRCSVLPERSAIRYKAARQDYEISGHTIPPLTKSVRTPQTLHFHGLTLVADSTTAVSLAS